VRDELSRVLGPLEAEVMQVLWPAGKPLSVRAVMDEMNEGRSAPLAYTTVMTVMARLAEKEILTRHREGRGFVYEPAAPDAATIAVRNVMRDFGDAALAGFVDEARANPKLQARLEQLLGGDGTS
jgi:predicted transcriptional regulator